MPKFKMTAYDVPNYPIDKYIEELAELMEEIQSKKDNIYEVPFSELSQIQFELDTSPDESIEIFNEKYAYAQSHYNRVSYILMQVKKELKTWQFYKGRLKILYRKAKNLLLINRPDIKALRNQTLQEAAIQYELDDLLDMLEWLDVIIDGIKHDVDIVTIKMDTLDKAIINLNRQQRVVEDEMALNGVIGIKGIKSQMIR